MESFPPLAGSAISFVFFFSVSFRQYRLIEVIVISMLVLIASKFMDRYFRNWSKKSAILSVISARVGAMLPPTGVNL